ncbi:hypothetical protein THASP1DRAFT_23111 [Thamnocephalis sphaerospora]|uniref:Retrotransposon gag domain-containing protein n=1 Tax=Thamnocephalis sphaerospora TaxID=78915 RepID=A0A4P9XSA2_9FUNG|nr:hypothetical protein THASP1DRAFT_23111 [Thamnocephalis sphaerospora]|eukprot:RKP08988.1 hypothetical protein THASP1DRAFT_23111 [Thamnocephalis sphaerospora]
MTHQERQEMELLKEEIRTLRETLSKVQGINLEAAASAPHNTDRQSEDSTPAFTKTIERFAAEPHQDPINWLRRLESRARLHQWTDAQKLFCVGYYFTGPASVWWVEVEDKIVNWKRGDTVIDFEPDCFYGAFFSYFIPTGLLSQWDDELGEAKLQPAHVRYLREVDERDIRRRFLAGLGRDMQVQVHLRTGVNAKLEDLLKAAKHVEYAFQMADHYNAASPKVTQSQSSLPFGASPVSTYVYQPTYQQVLFPPSQNQPSQLRRPPRPRQPSSQASLFFGSNTQ